MATTAFNQEKALEGAFSVITNLRMELFQALLLTALEVLPMLHTARINNYHFLVRVPAVSLQMKYNCYGAAAGDPGPAPSLIPAELHSAQTCSSSD